MDDTKKRSNCKSCYRPALLMTTGCVVLLLYINIPETSFKPATEKVEAVALSNKAESDHSNESSIPNFKVLWYNPPPFINNRREARNCGFGVCKFKNCQMSFKRTEATNSHAVIFDGRFIPQRLNFSRPSGQIWIFAAHESPLTYGAGGNWWFKNRTYVFNWTMTYNKDNTDIHLPYGEILKHTEKVKRDFRKIAQQKNRTALIIASHCKTSAKRQEYVSQLQKYVDVDILGLCGKKWNCGFRYKHDECFNLLNTSYKFYLAFENAICHQYFTEKFYENFNYDVIMVTRGGSKGEAKNIFPTGTFISTDDFSSIKELGRFLHNINTDDYAKLLERKSQFYSPGYGTVYQKALCEICERLNHDEKYGKVNNDMHSWAFEPKACSSEIGDMVTKFHPNPFMHKKVMRWSQKNPHFDI